MHIKPEIRFFKKKIIFFYLESADHEVSAFQNAEGKNSYINGPDSDA